MRSLLCWRFLVCCILKGTFAAFLACAMSTLLLFGWFQEGEAIKKCTNVDASYFRRGDSLHGAADACNGDSSIVFGALGGVLRMDDGRCCSLLLSSFLGGVSGAVAEVLPLGLDDNLSLPVVSGAMFMVLHRWYAKLCGDVQEVNPIPEPGW